MNNLQYLEIVKSKLLEFGYPESNLDILANQVITVASNNNLNVIHFLEKYFLEEIRTGSFNPDVNEELNTYSDGSSFTTQRHASPEINRFIRRQIIRR